MIWLMIKSNKNDIINDKNDKNDIINDKNDMNDIEMI